MKIKKMSPTPKSITQRKPTKISPSSNNNKEPKAIRYIPAKYHNVKILIVFIKKIRVIKMSNCKKKTSFNIFLQIN